MDSHAGSAGLAGVDGLSAERSAVSPRARHRGGARARSPAPASDEVDAAVARARAALPAWRALAPGRARAAAARARRHARRRTSRSWRVLEARNAGKPIADARGEMGMVVDTFRYYAGAPERLLGDTIPVAGGQAFTVREPLGVVGLIMPWNFPLTIAAWKLAPALAAGNTVVLKPAELTPLTRAALRRARARGGHARRACVNVVVGPGRTCGQRLVEHPDVAKIAFTGSTEVGRSIAAGAARDDQARDARARRQVGEHRLRRRRPRGRRRGRAVGGVRQRRPGLLRALADPRRRRRCSSASSSCSSAHVRALARRRPARRDHADGPADLRRAARRGRLVPRRRRPGRVPRQRARGPRLLVRADGARARSTPSDARRARGDLRARSPR